MAMKLLRSISGLVSVLLCVVLLSIVLCSEKLSDPVGDLLDPQGNPTAGESYLDIVEAEVSFEGSSCVVRINVSGPIPASVPESVFIEWGLLIDADRNRTTRPWGDWFLIDNGLGADVLARVKLGKYGLEGEVITWSAGRAYGLPTDFKVDGTVAEVRFDTSKVGNSSAFDYVIEIRKYVDNYLAMVDKCPNQGSAWVAVTRGVPRNAPLWPITIGVGFAVLIVAVVFVRGVLTKRRSS